MTPVMAHCRCGWPIADCLTHNPPSLFAPTVTPDNDEGDPRGVALDEVAPIAVTIAIGGVTAATVVGAVTVAAWAAGVAIDALRSWRS